MAESMAKGGALLAVFVAGALFLVPACIVQTGTRPAVVEDSGEADALATDGAAGGGADTGDAGVSGSDAAKNPDGSGGSDAGAVVGDTGEPESDTADVASVEDAPGGDSTDGGWDVGDADAVGVDDTTDGGVNDAVGDAADGVTTDTDDTGAPDVEATDTGGTGTPDADVTVPQCAPGSCDDGNACTDDSCEADVGCVHTALDCDDGNACTDDSCEADLGCVHTALDCDDGNLCTDDSCSAAAGCASVASTKPCDDGDACTVGEKCSEGKCGSGKALLCDDGTACTVDDCDTATGCTHDAAPGKCDDGDACTVGDACEAGACQPGQKILCDDLNPCTDETCDAVGGCDYSANVLPCLDGDPCTLDDACAEMACVPGPKDLCDDANPCTDDSCADGCVHTPSGAICDDGDACTIGDACSAGACGGTPMDCDDGDACTVGDACVASGCVPGPVKECNDGDPCTVGDACVGGECVAGTPKSCPDDGNPCSGEVCVSGTGECVAEPLDGAPCDYDGGPDSGMCNGSDCVPASCGETTCPPLPGYGRSCNGAVCRYMRLEQTAPWHAQDVWVWVPPGSFTMGSPDLDDMGQPEERPAHVVTLAYGFFVQETEITVAEHAACEADGGCSAPMVGANADADHPQNGIDRQQAEDLCAWLGGRLPTEAEWEYAANGPGMHRRYPWGEDEPSCGSVGGMAVCFAEGTLPASSKVAGAAPTGGVDMAGNVAEWVEDCYHSTYDGARIDGNAWSQDCGNFGVVRGGSYGSEGAAIRTASREARPVDGQSPTVGARCVRTFEHRCGGVTCPHLDGYSVACNVEDHCEYHRLEQPEGWHDWDQWIYVPPGSFEMGCPADGTEPCNEYEQPVHTVTLAEGYLLGKHEVVVSQHEACEAVGACSAPSTADWGGGWGTNRSTDGRGTHPQNGLTWQQAKDVCAWLTPGGRLPSESEWEFAATGPVHRKYPWGDSPEPTCTNGTAVFDEAGGTAGYGCGEGGTWEAGSKPAGASARGALDMAGNVWEWVEDCWHETYSGAPAGADAWTTSCSGSSRIVRGDSFYGPAAGLRSVQRATGTPGSRYASRGARCARPLPHTCGTTECPVLGGYEVSCNVANHCEYRRFAPSEPWHEWDQWIYVPPGSFEMGCPEGGSEQCKIYEQPVHTVTLAAGFLIGKYEVVVSQYEACETEGVCTGASTADWDGAGWGTNSSSNDRTGHSQNGLTWQQGKDVCGWIAPGGRLPSESEWEFAATGPVHRKYPWGDGPEPTCSNGTAVFDELGEAVGYGCGEGGTWAVGSKSAGASSCGALDMAGNVWEWAEDCWHDTYGGAPAVGEAWTTNCSGTERVTRGGGFSDAAAILRTARREHNVPADRHAYQGARCARDICLTDTDCDDDDPVTSDACNAGVCHHDPSMVEIPPGPFWMGCNASVDSECSYWEKPQHEVTLSGYQIDQTEVTVAAYENCVAAGACSAKSDGDCGWGETNYGKAGKSKYPMNCVGWYDAEDYCAWAGKRLCTESEWEKAARGGCEEYPGQTCSEAMPEYPWGNAVASCTYAVYDSGGNGCGTDTTWPVGSKAAGASSYGALDMAGNVREWVEDCWHNTYTGAPSDGSSWTTGCSGSQWVLRGGGYSNDGSYLRASARYIGDSSNSGGSLGLRCCSSVTP